MIVAHEETRIFARVDLDVWLEDANARSIKINQKELFILMRRLKWGAHKEKF
jgi:hypothetical protein